MTALNVYDTAINWQTLGDFKYFVFTVLHVDDQTHTVDAILKFEPNEKIFIHRHCAQTNTFVIHGEHRLYYADGRMKEVRPQGSYTASSPDVEPHSEGGGDTGAIVFYSVRGNAGTLFEILDDQQNLVGQLSYDDFKALSKQG